MALGGGCGGVYLSRMKMSGFSFVRNGAKLYYPVQESILSALELVDEFVVAVGQGDDDDETRALIAAIDSPKVKIIDTVWDMDTYPRGTVHAQQTDLAKNACSGDWLLYLQADELIHEQDHAAIRAACERYNDDQEVEGLLFKYYHFWGDYEHYHYDHVWYKHEIRVIRNKPEIHSWESAQSFRRIPNFDGKNYRQQQGTFKLKVAPVDAHIYHYGWVRPPDFMQRKKKALDTNHHGAGRSEELNKGKQLYDYGPLQKLKTFTGTHPKVMQERIAQHNWKDQLQYSGPPSPNRPKHKHEKPKYRLLSWIENTLLGGKTIGGFKNYIKVR